MSVLEYESLTDYDAKHGYPWANEDIAIWREFVKGKHIRRAAGVCAGGDVGLFALLPTVRDELVLVDHSVCSLKYTMQKYLVFETHGVEGAQDLFVKGGDSLRNALAEVNRRIPPQVCSSADSYHSPYSGEALASADYDRSRTVARKKHAVCTVKKTALRRAVTKFGKVKFIHGDFQALVDRGPFDLFYLSNAHQMGNGNMRTPLLEHVTNAVRDGGWVLAAGDHDSLWTYPNAGKTTKPNGGFPANWELTDVIHPAYDRRFVQWPYRIFKVRKDT